MSSDEKSRKLLDRDEIFEGLEMGLDIFPISTFWRSLEYFYQTGKRGWVMSSYIIFVHLLGFVYCLLGFVAIFVIDMDFRRATAAIMNPICGLQTLFKCWTFSYSMREYLDLLTLIKRNFISCVPPEKEEQAKALRQKSVDSTNLFVRYAFYWNALTLFMVSFMPYLRSQVFREALHIGEGPIERNKLCENEYPFAWSTSPTYELIWLFEQIAVIVAIVTCSAYQAILLFLVMALVTHLRVLGFVMEDLKIKDFSDGFEDKRNQSMKRKGLLQLIKCIKDHQKINEAGDKLAERYNSFLTFHLSTATVVGIIAIYNSSSSDTVADVIKFAIMCVYGLLEVALYCMCGQLLENASEDVHRQVYLCEWDEMDPDFRRTAKLMMTRANNPISLRAGRLYRVNLETFARIEQTVYSALTMLRSS